MATQIAYTNFNSIKVRLELDDPYSFKYKDYLISIP